MAKKLSAEEIKALNGLKDDEREGLIALLTDVESANAEIQKLRKSQPTESQKVVESAAWAEMEKAVKDRDDKNKALEARVAELSLPAEVFYGPFDAIFALFR